MLITITDVRPDQELFLAWCDANELGNPLSVALPITLDLERRTIRFDRVERKAHDGQAPTGNRHEVLLPLIVDLPEPIMAKVGMLDNAIVYPAVMV